MVSVDVRQQYRRLIEQHVSALLAVQHPLDSTCLSKSELKRRIGAVEKQLRKRLNVRRVEDIADIDELAGALGSLALHECAASPEDEGTTCTTGTLARASEEEDEHSALGRTELMFAALPGKDKYLGGVCARNGVLYGVPGHARTLLRIDPATNRCTQLPLMELLAPQLLGEALSEVLLGEEARAEASEDGSSRLSKLRQMAALAHALAWGAEEQASTASTCTAAHLTRRKNPLLKALRKAAARQVEKYSAVVRGVFKWLRGCCASDGCVYCIPSHADFVLKVFPETDDVELLPIEGISHGAAPRSVLGSEPLPSWRQWVREFAALHDDAAAGALVDEREFALRALLRCAPQLGTCANSTDAYAVEPCPNSIWRWHGGVIARDGHVYGIPCNSPHVLKIEVGARRASLFGCADAIGTEVSKWYGGILGGDGNIYGIPQNGRKVLRINVVPRAGEQEQSADQIGPDLGSGGWKWHGGCLSWRDGCIYGIPNHVCEVLKIDPMTGSVTLHGTPEEVPAPQHRADGKYKYLGGVVSGRDGSVYCVPGDADRVLKIVPRVVSSSPEGPAGEDAGPELKLIGRSFAAVGNEQQRALASNMVQNKWQNGFYASDGRIYAIPLKAERVLCVDPELEETDPERCVTTVPILGPTTPAADDARDTAGAGHEQISASELLAARTGFNKWEGGVMGLDGTMYCMPLNCRYTLKVTPGARGAQAELASTAASTPERGGNSNE